MTRNATRSGDSVERVCQEWMRSCTEQEMASVEEKRCSLLSLCFDNADFPSTWYQWPLYHAKLSGASSLGGSGVMKLGHPVKALDIWYRNPSPISPWSCGSNHGRQCGPPTHSSLDFDRTARSMQCLCISRSTAVITSTGNTGTVFTYLLTPTSGSGTETCRSTSVIQERISMFSRP